MDRTRPCGSGLRGAAAPSVSSAPPGLVAFSLTARAARGAGLAARPGAARLAFLWSFFVFCALLLRSFSFAAEERRRHTQHPPGGVAATLAETNKRRGAPWEARHLLTGTLAFPATSAPPKPRH